MSLLDAQSAAVQVGRQVVEQEGVDVIVMRLSGEVNSDEARQLVLLDRAQARRCGYSLVLIDGRQMAGFGSEARKAVFDEMKRHQGYLGTTACFGLSGAMIWIMKLVLRGVALLSPTMDDEVQIFSTEAEARAFLNQRRPLRQQKAAAR